MSDGSLDPRVARAVEMLKRPPVVDPAATARVMAAVALAKRPVRLPWHRAPRTWVVGAALAAGLAGIAVVRSGGAGAGEPALDVTPAARGTLGVPAPAPALLAVDFVLDAPDAARVTLAGDFNGWAADGLVLERGVGGAWRVTVPLAPGRYRYAFVVDGQDWRPDPRAATEVDDAFGATSVIVVGARP